MNWDDLRVFLALARSSTLAGATTAAGLDATTISRRVARLEKVIGLTLFEHAVSGQVLTENGQRLLAHAERMEAGAEAIRARSEPASALSGTIRVSASEGFGTWFIAQRLAGFAAAHPAIAVDLIASTGFLNPSRREADIAIMLARPRGGPLVAGKLTDYALGAYASTAILTDSPIETIDDLLCRRLIGYVPDLIYAPELRYLSDIDPRSDAGLRSSSITAQARLIASGCGVGILPCFLAAMTDGLTRILPETVVIRRSFWLVVHRDTRRLARIQAFVTWLRTEVANAQATLLGTFNPSRDG